MNLLGINIDTFLTKILDEYDGFQYKSTLSEEQARYVLAQYAMACQHDTKLAQEAMKVCENRGRL